MLGVYLGAQQLAAALGAAVYEGLAPEAGVGSVRLTPAGLLNPVLGAGGDPLPVLHWHGDTFDLPDGARLLASSNAYRHQAFRAGRAYGLQFHVEMDAPAVETARPHLPVGTVLEPTGLDAVEAAGRRVLAAWAAALTAPTRGRRDYRTPGARGTGCEATDGWGCVDQDATVGLAIEEHSPTMTTPSGVAALWTPRGLRPPSQLSPRFAQALSGSPVGCRAGGP